MSSEHENHGLWLPGYTLSTKLGAGGYGEVWLAHAPGGLTKAVKFIFGSYHDKRAEHELKALQKVKEVRHPFLLSLERIEVVDGRLVIVTELADSSLKDRFDECVQQGLPGVPRDELLGYLRDAADALDFLSQKHKLQHLDVKPENLLLVGGHVKVADFGLVKDVGKSQASLVGGLTPLYSAPEVFQGSPSPFSDQYSLAVLYQEMLTGVLPFNGMTAAELTLQHLNDNPDLSPVPEVDRYVLSQALAKDPTQRFESCSEMVAALFSRRDERPGGWAAPAEAAQPAAAPATERRVRPITELFGEQFDGGAGEISKSMVLEAPPLLEPLPRALAPVDVSSDGFAAQPTLVIGIGGAAGDVLRQFRLRMTKQFGDERIPGVQMLLLDSDAKAIAKAQSGDPRTTLRAEEALTLALRRPQEYREQSARLMKWLSRRWLYNIPRSLRTDGMRPLGRLAFADHARQVVQRIRMAIAQATAADAIEQSQALTGQAFGGTTPRVYVVASISGGAGSGMSLDVGYAVRTALDKLGASATPIIGIFVHATGNDPRHCDLAKVNSYAWLTEYNHFHRPGGQFPGDETCGLPPMPAGRRAFDSAYLVDGGAADEGAETSESAAAIAEYMFLDALTPAQTFFDACRHDDHRSIAAAPLRTFAVHSFTAAPDATIDLAAASLAREVVLSWTGGSGDRAKVSAGANAAAQLSGGAEAAVRDTNQIVQGAATFVAQLQLKLDALASNSRSLVEAQFGGDLQEFLTDLFAAVGPADKATNLLDMTRAIDRLFAPPPGEAPTGAYVLQRPLDAIVSPLSMKLASDLSQWILRKIDDPRERLAGAQRACQWLVDHLKSLEGDAARMGEGLARQVAMIADELRRDPRAGRVEGAGALAKASAYFRMRIDHQAVGATILIARRLLAELKVVSGTVAEFGRHMKHLAASFPDGGQPNALSPDSDPLGASLAANMTALVEEIDGQIQEQFIADLGGLFPAIMGNSRVRAQMLSTLGKLARRAVENLAARPDVMNAALSALTPGERDVAPNGDELPPLMALGGAYRKLAIVPSEAAGGRPLSFWRDALAGEASLVATAGSDVATVYEGWRLPLVHLGISLIHSRRDYADFATRVYTRSDIAWLPLVASTSPQTILASAFDEETGGGLGGVMGDAHGVAGLGLGIDAPTITHGR